MFFFFPRFRTLYPPLSLVSFPLSPFYISTRQRTSSGIFLFCSGARTHTNKKTIRREKRTKKRAYCSLSFFFFLSNPSLSVLFVLTLCSLHAVSPVDQSIHLLLSSFFFWHGSSRSGGEATTQSFEEYESGSIEKEIHKKRKYIHDEDLDQRHTHTNTHTKNNNNFVSGRARRRCLYLYQLFAHPLSFLSFLRFSCPDTHHFFFLLFSF